ncbi:MAG: topology modulation protein [uncultured bacterium]|nr:MAG: topology modulation protein [uncultured bacterium]
MKKILILGSCGAGKSTLAKKLHEVLGIDIIHLDQHYWKPDWTRTEKEEWQKKVSDLTSRESWIMDGNYRSTLDIRIPKSDAIVWLDFSPLVCFRRVLKRRLRKNRVDDIEGCRERVTFELLKWVLWTFPRINRKEIEEKIEQIKKEKDIYILRSDREVNNFLLKLKSRDRSE